VCGGRLSLHGVGMNLDAHQQRAVDSDATRIRVQAGAGSGKTRTLVARVQRLLVAGVDPKRLCVITFTRAAADELMHRLTPDDGFGEAHAPGGMTIGTIHSLGAKILRAANRGRKIADEAHRRRLLRKAMIDTETMPEEVPLGVLSTAVSRWKLDREPLPKKVVAAAHRYQTLLREGWLHDFDDLLCLAVETLNDGAKAYWQDQFDEVLVDEGQDTSRVQWDLLAGIVGVATRVFVVGDVQQCHPPGTLVRLKKDQRDPGRYVPIQLLKVGDRVQAWDRHDKAHYAGMRVEAISDRGFSGNLLQVQTAEGLVEVTPDHRFVAKWVRPTPGWCVTYLMWRPGFGFRVGWCQLFDRTGKFHLAQRARIEKAERTWILRVFESRMEASLYESIVAARHGIPTATFEPVHGATHLVAENIRQIFDALRDENDVRGRRCLTAHLREYDYPLYGSVWEEIAAGRAAYTRWTIFEVRAANLEPMLMGLPAVEKPKTWVPILSVSPRAYSGRVFSLQVEKHHSYVADNVTVLNCIYSWRGAAPDEFLHGLETRFGMFETYPLPKNYRSLPEVITLANRVMHGRPGSLTLEAVREGTGLVVERLPAQPSEVDEAAQITAKLWTLRDQGMLPQWSDAAVLVRTNAYTEAIEGAMMTAGIPAVVLGGMAFYQRYEIQDVLAYLTLAVGWDTEAAERVYNKPARYLGKVFREELAKQGGWPAVARGQGMEFSRPSSRRGFKDFLNDVHTLHRRVDEGPASLVDFVVHDLGYQEWLLGETIEDEGDQSVAENLARLQRAAGRWESVKEFLAYTAACRRKLTGNPVGRVQISTIHRAKGMEWPVVILAGLNVGLLPHKRAKTPGEREEEVRILYTAITRARDYLGLTSGDIPSPFVAEMGFSDAEETHVVQLEDEAC